MMKRFLFSVFLLNLFLLQESSGISEKKSGRVFISERKGLIKSFPCAECHRLTNPAKRNPENRPPSHLRLTLNHMKDISSCDTCHTPGHMNQLRTLSKEPVSFDESFRICVQCHGEKGRDWRRGIHGKQVGSWSGDKIRYNCTDCHEPHDPGFKSMIPVADPPFPELGIPKGNVHEFH